MSDSKVRELENPGRLLPTLPGFAPGFVGDQPPTLQCHDCFALVEGPRASWLVILSGFHFHPCEGRSGVRRCPSCLARALAGCGRRSCQSEARSLAGKG